MFRDLITACGIELIILALIFAPIDTRSGLTASLVCVMLALPLFIVAGLMSPSDEKINPWPTQGDM